MKSIILASSLIALVASSSAFAKVTSAHCEVVDQSGAFVTGIPMTKIGEDGHNPAFVGNSESNVAHQLGARVAIMDEDEILNPSLNNGDKVDPSGSIRTEAEFIDVKDDYILTDEKHGGGHHSVMNKLQRPNTPQGGKLASDFYKGFQVKCSVEVKN